MKVVNTENVEVKAKAPSKAFVTLYNRETGKSQDFHAIDANEVMAGYSHIWSYTPVSREQEKAEDAVIVPESVEAPALNTEPEPMPLPRRGRRPTVTED